MPAAARMPHTVLSHEAAPLSADLARSLGVVLILFYPLINI